MPIPDSIHQLASSAQFWANYLWLEDRSDDEYPTLERLRVDLDVCPGYRVTLGLDEYLSYHALGFIHPGVTEPVELGFDDMAHWHPNALRWEELDLIGRCLALSDPLLPHPGLPVLLLNRFTPVCLNTDADAMFPMLESAWRSLEAFPASRLDELVERYDRRHAEFIWKEEPVGWTIGLANADTEDRTGWICYTFRDGEGDGFPFREWGEFLAAAEQHYLSAANPEWLTRNGGAAEKVARALAETGDADGAEVLADALLEAGCEHLTILEACRSREPARFGWVVELLLGAPRGSVIRRIFGPTAHVRRTWYGFTVQWPEAPERPRGSPYAGHAVARAIADALTAHNLVGSASLNGSMSRTGTDGRPVDIESSIGISVRDECERGIAVIREVLLAQNAPAGLVWRQDTPERRRIPLATSAPSD